MDRTHEEQSTRVRYSLPDRREPSWFSLLSDSLNFGNAETCLDVGCGVTFIQWKYSWSRENNESKSIAQRREYRW